MTNGPISLGIIMDGNRRWARAQGLPSFAGHRQGAEKLKEVLEWTKAQGVKHLIVYAFSTENWKRNENEVAELMKLLNEYLGAGLKELSDAVSIRFLGELDRFPKKIQEGMNKLEEDSKGKELTLSIALSYGGRADILQAANSLIQKGHEVLTEELLSSALLTRGTPDPDMIIRTGGEQRLSNFLTWQSVYSELVFTDTLWPALTKEEFDQHIETFRARKRNYGA